MSAALCSSQQSSAMPRKVEILVAGAGPAGMAAAIAAASCGKDVVVLDDNAAAGGQIWRAGHSTRTIRDADDTLRQRVHTAFSSSGAKLLAGRRIVDAPRLHLLRASHETGHGTVVESFLWKHLILATGARERFLPFPGWTLPGVFGAGGLQALVKGGFSVEGKRVVVAGTGPLLLAVAAHLRQEGAHVVCLSEQARLRQIFPFALATAKYPEKLLQGLRYRAGLLEVPYYTSRWPVAALGESKLEAVRLTDGHDIWEESCDLLACGFHLVPNVELASLLDCRIVDGAVAVDAQQRTSVDDIYGVGELTGVAGLRAALAEGEIAGLCAAGNPQSADKLYAQRDRERKFASALNRAFQLRNELRSLASPETIVCRCEDVPYSQLLGHASWTEAKLQTRCGMGPCQGRICGAALETLFHWRIESIRPPLFPIPIAAIADDHSASQ